LIKRERCRSERDSNEQSFGHKILLFGGYREYLVKGSSLFRMRHIGIQDIQDKDAKWL